MEKFPIVAEEQKSEEEGEVTVEGPDKEYARKMGEVASWLEENKTDLHTEEIKLDDLDREDLELFLRFKEGTLTQKELDEYNHELAEEFERNRENKKREDFEASNQYHNSSRIAFGAMLKNKLLSRLAGIRLKELGIDPDKEE